MKTDSQLQIDVINQLKWEASVTHEGIGVSVKKGVVTLTGTVPTHAEKSKAEEAVLKVSGARAVVTHLNVKSQKDYERDDVDIARAASAALEWNSLVPPTIKAVVNAATVTLTGEVIWKYQKDAAEAAVKDLMGVHQVSNHIKFKYSEPYHNLKERIRMAIKRARTQDVDDIIVNVSGSTVTLKGTVKTPGEREAVEAAAWSAPGIVNVKDDIHVKYL